MVVKEIIAESFTRHIILHITLIQLCLRSTIRMLLIRDVVLKASSWPQGPFLWLWPQRSRPWAWPWERHQQLFCISFKRKKYNKIKNNWTLVHCQGMPAYSEHAITYVSAYLPTMSISHISCSWDSKEYWLINFNCYFIFLYSLDIDVIIMAANNNFLPEFKRSYYTYFTWY